MIVDVGSFASVALLQPNVDRLDSAVPSTLSMCSDDCAVLSASSKQSLFWGLARGLVMKVLMVVVVDFVLTQTHRHFQLKLTIFAFVILKTVF